MGRLLWDAGWATKASFVLWQRLFPLRRWAPVELSPVDVWVDRRVLEEGVERGGVVVRHLEEALERPDAGAFFFEKLDNRFSFPFVDGGGVRR